jgi:hypothetical protein
LAQPTAIAWTDALFAVLLAVVETKGIVLNARTLAVVAAALVVLAPLHARSAKFGTFFFRVVSTFGEQVRLAATGLAGVLLC